ncbi:hypothetical protein [Actinokineospora sp.]|uniref:hypothetical protein n=1 Tax=Actinokineospora sp. TaxID=1872133 RepID=UPI003D6AAC85
MNFKVDPPSVSALAKLMGRAGSAASIFAAANNGAGPSEFGEGLLRVFLDPAGHPFCLVFDVD